MNCSIIQPSYIPWRGYFHSIQKADVFVFYDDVQYDKHGWRNRNRIKTADGARWLTVPLEHRQHRLAARRGPAAEDGRDVVGLEQLPGLLGERRPVGGPVLDDRHDLLAEHAARVDVAGCSRHDSPCA